MPQKTEEQMRELGRHTGANATREEAKRIIDGLVESIRELRNEKPGRDNERTIFNLKAAIEGIRETMPRE